MVMVPAGCPIADCMYSMRAPFSPTRYTTSASPPGTICFMTASAIMPIMGLAGCSAAFSAFLISMCVVYFKSALSGTVTTLARKAARIIFFMKVSEQNVVSSRPVYKEPLVASPSGRCRHTVELGGQRVQVFSECRVALEGVASHLLIRTCRHAGKATDVRLQTGLALSDRFGEQLRGGRVHLIGFHAVGAAPPANRLCASRTRAASWL